MHASSTSRRRTPALLVVALALAACGGGGTTAPAQPPVPPTITGVSPATGSPVGGALVTISGTGFVQSPAPTVLFGAAPATVVSAGTSSLIVTAPAHAAGAASITVTNADGGSAVDAGAFTYVTPPPPALAQAAPTAGAQAGGEPVTLTGTGFSPPVTVHFGAAAGTIITQSATSVTVDSPPGTGTVSLTLTNSDGQASNALTFTYVAGTPPPSISSVAPSSGSTAGGQDVAISGQGFSNPPTVHFGSTPAAVKSAGPTLITVAAPAHAAGTVAVSVTNPDTQADTLAAAYTYVAPPTLTGVAPTSGTTGGGDSVTLTGTGFAAAPTVTFGGTPATVAAGGTATTLTVTTPAHAAGLVDVSVTNPGGLGSTLAGAFTFTAPAGTPPTVSSVLNDVTGLPSGAAAGGQAVTLTGTGFAPGAQVLFGAVQATGVVWHSVTSMSAVTPLSQPVGPVDVTVLLPGTGLAGTLHAGFTFLGPSPHVVALGVVGSPPAGGDLLVIKGTGLQATSTVTFGTASATVTSFTPGGTLDELVVVIPQSPLGLDTDGFVDLTVHNPDGQSDTMAPRHSSDGTPWPHNFHYGRPPVATGFSPAGGKGLDVTVTGTDFSADATGPRAGIQVLFSGPSFAIPVVRKCGPGITDPACPAGAVSPSPTSLIAEVPSKQLNPGNYIFVVTNFDGQTTHTPGFFVVP